MRTEKISLDNGSSHSLSSESAPIQLAQLEKKGIVECLVFMQVVLVFSKSLYEHSSKYGRCISYRQIYACIFSIVRVTFKDCPPLHLRSSLSNSFSSVGLPEYTLIRCSQFQHLAI